MRLYGLLVLIVLASACGGSDAAGEDSSPSVNIETVVVTTDTETDAAGEDNSPSVNIETVVVTTDTETDAATGVVSMEPLMFQTTTLAPPSSELKNEGDVLLEVRTEEGELDTAWVAESSGFPEVDEFALDYVRTSKMVVKLGRGDPPYRMMVYVRVPIESGDGISPSKYDASEENEFILIPLSVPRESEIRNEGDMVVEARLAGGLIDTAWVAVSSGFPEVDEFAMDYLEKNPSSHSLQGYQEDQPIRLLVLVRQPSGKDVE